MYGNLAATSVAKQNESDLPSAVMSVFGVVVARSGVPVAAVHVGTGIRILQEEHHQTIFNEAVRSDVS